MTNKDCTSCVHRALNPQAEPCASCQDGGMGTYMNWKPANPFDLSTPPPRKRTVEIPAPTPAHELEDAFREAEVQHAQASALDTQVGGDHYAKLKIQPIEYIHANGIPFAEGCAIKYLTRWRDKGGVKDLEKAKHFIELLIELEGRA